MSSMFEALPGESEDDRRKRVKNLIAQEQAKQSMNGAQNRAGDAFKSSGFDPTGTKP